MIDSKTLGKRIQFFRKRAGFSQFALETAINASSGMISRIESGKVNPSKETVQKIALECELSPLELDYLIGRTANAASAEEVNRSYQKVKEYMDKFSVFAYFTDERWRVFYFSKGFVKLMGASKEVVENLYGKTIVEILLDESLGVKPLFNSYDYLELVKVQLAYYKRENSYMQDDPSFIRSLKLIQSNGDILKYWNSLKIDDLGVFFEKDQRVVKFNIAGVEINMDYSRERLLDDVRFEVVEYTPLNKYLRAVQNLLKAEK